MTTIPETPGQVPNIPEEMPSPGYVPEITPVIIPENQPVPKETPAIVPNEPSQPVIPTEIPLAE